MQVDSQDFLSTSLKQVWKNFGLVKLYRADRHNAFLIGHSRTLNLCLASLLCYQISYTVGSCQSGKFVLCNRDLGCAVLMFPIYFIVNFQNLGRAICKLSSQGHVWIFWDIYFKKVSFLCTQTRGARVELPNPTSVWGEGFPLSFKVSPGSPLQTIYNSSK